LNNPHPTPEITWTSRILLSGFEPSSTVNWPGRVAATIYLRGCPWRCAYCHNPHLQKRGCAPSLSWQRVTAQLEAQRAQLQGVVFSGGEPTAESTLPEAIASVRAMGLPVGLQTSGAYPERLAAVLPLLDWVGLDLKTDYAGYDQLTGAPGSAARVTQSARAIVASGVAHEFRLTWHHEVLSEEAALLAAHFARHLGAQRFVLQLFRQEGVENTELAPDSMPSPALVEQIRALFADFELRSEICGLAD